jgi:hypothetical protein
MYIVTNCLILPPRIECNGSIRGPILARVGRTNWRAKATIGLVSAKETNMLFVLVEEMTQVIAMHYI